MNQNYNDALLITDLSQKERYEDWWAIMELIAHTITAGVIGTSLHCWDYHYLQTTRQHKARIMRSRDTKASLTCLPTRSSWTLLARYRPHQPDSQIIATVGAKIETVHHTNPLIIAVPSSTTIDATKTRIRTEVIRRIRSCVHTLPVPDPFVNITAHVAQAKAVTLFFAYSVGRALAVPLMPGHLIQIFTSSIDVWLPTQAAYSHSVSVGSRQPRQARPLGHATWLSFIS